jgi:hypothetical protein
LTICVENRMSEIALTTNQTPCNLTSALPSSVSVPQQQILQDPQEEPIDVDLEETFTNPLADEDEEIVSTRSSPPPVYDPDLEVKVRRACERISENVHICANEPSLAFFRLSEHVRKALPPTVESRQQVQTIQRQLGGAYEDAEFALQYVVVHCTS